MFGLFFGPKNVVGKDQEDWICEQYLWLIENIGFPNEPVPLITPTATFFNDLPENGHERARHIFSEVKRHMGLNEWPCELVAQEEDINPQVGETLIVENIPVTPLGTFSVTSKDTVTISYNPKELSDNQSLISTFAHELSHYVLACCDKPRLGDEKDEEFLTDLFAIASGFGLFLANSEFNFRQFRGPFSQGWQTSGSGYLTEREVIFALTLFMQRNKYNIVQAETYLKKHLYSLLKEATRYADKKAPEQELLRKI